MRRIQKILSLFLAAVLALGLTLPAHAVGGQAAAASSPLLVDGTAAACERYTINGELYVKLRDLAMALSGTAAQFAVSYHAAGKVVELTTGMPYVPVGGEQSAAAGSAAAQDSSWRLAVDGSAVSCEMYVIGGSNYVRPADLGEALGYTACFIADSGALAITTDTAAGSTLLKALVINMGADKTVTDAMYDAYFQEGSALDGVKAILAAGRFYINDFAIPATAEDLDILYPSGSYLLNQSAWLTRTDEGYQVGKDTYESYADAALAAATDFDAGLEVRLYDSDGDGFADWIAMDYVEAVIVNKIVDLGDGTYSIQRSQVDASYVWDSDGRYYDGDHFTADSGEVIAARNLDSALQEGDMGLFWYGPDGWAIERALEVTGILVDGEDHAFYQIGDVQYEDAMRFSRDNIIVSNRCGEFVNAQKYFGLNNSGDGLTVSLWFVPTTDPGVMAAPAGFTTNGNAAAFLAQAIDAAREKLSGVVVSADGTDVPAGQDWVKQEVYDALEATIQRAETALADDLSEDVLTYHVYLLYLSLKGTGSDIGAMYAGFDYPGFDNQLNGAEPAPSSISFGG